jgi:glycosyltransferase involved in cell wall biosynthesis
LARWGGNAKIVSGRRDLGIVSNSKHDVLYRLLRGQFDQVQAVSEAARQVCIQKDGLSPERVFTVHNGVNLPEILSEPSHPNFREAYGLSPRGPIMISATGHLWPVKGTDVLIRAAAIVCQKVPDANFVMFGWDGNEYAQRMRDLVKELKLESNVKIAGRLSPISSAFKCSDIMCQLSRSEGMSNALLESMACGLPSVATAVGGNPETIVDGKTGFLVPNEDSSEAARRILELIENPEIRKEMGKRSFERIRDHFTVDGMASTVAQLYDRLIDKE